MSSQISLTKPKTIIIEKIISSFTINNITINLGVSADITVSLFDDNNNLMSNMIFNMDEKYYQEWTNNDVPYIQNFVESQINLLKTL